MGIMVKIVPDKDGMIRSLDDAEKYTAWAVAYLVIAAASLVAMYFAPKFLLPAFLAACVVSACLGGVFWRWSRKVIGKVTDINDSYVMVGKDDDGNVILSCRQTSKDRTYEECVVYADEVEKIVTRNSNDDPGFYIYLEGTGGQSEVIVNDILSERYIFFVDGSPYDAGDFSKVFTSFVDNCGAKTKVVGSVTWKNVSFKKRVMVSLLALVLAGAAATAVCLCFKYFF